MKKLFAMTLCLAAGACMLCCRQGGNAFKAIDSNYHNKHDSLSKVQRDLWAQRDPLMSREARALSLQQHDAADAEKKSAEREWIEAQLGVIKRIPVSDEVMRRLGKISEQIRFANPAAVDFRADVTALYDSLADERRNSPAGRVIYDNLQGPGQWRSERAFPTWRLSTSTAMP